MIPDVLRDKELTPQEIKDNLMANCDITEEREFIRPFTDEEVQNEEMQFSGYTKQIFDAKEELEKVSSPIKDQIKELNKKQLAQRNLLKQGGFSFVGPVYDFYDHENKLVNSYDENANLIGSRPMGSKERQISMKFLSISQNG